MSLPFEQQPSHEPLNWQEQPMQQQFEEYVGEEESDRLPRRGKLQPSDEDLLDLMADLIDRVPGALSEQMVTAVREEIAKRQKDEDVE